MNAAKKFEEPTFEMVTAKLPKELVEKAKMKMKKQGIWSGKGPRWTRLMEKLLQSYLGINK